MGKFPNKPFSTGDRTLVLRLEDGKYNRKWNPQWLFRQEYCKQILSQPISVIVRQVCGSGSPLAFAKNMRVPSHSNPAIKRPYCSDSVYNCSLARRCSDIHLRDMYMCQHLNKVNCHMDRFL